MIVQEIIANMTPLRAVAGIIGFFVLTSFLSGVYYDRRVRRLGAHAPRVKIYLPIGLDFIYKATRANRAKAELQFWDKSLAEAGPYHGPGKNANLEVNGNSKFRLIFTVDPENIKAVLTGQFADFGKGHKFHEEWKEFLGDSIFATDGELWSRSRHLIRPMFARDRIVDTEIFEKHIHKLIPMLGGSKNPNQSKVVDVQPFFFQFTLDAATDYLLGHSVDSLDNPKTIFAESFQYVLHRQAIMFRSGPISPLMSRVEFRANLKKMDDFMQPFIDEVLSMTPEELEKRLAKQDTFLHALARFTRDPKVIRDQLVAILLAGRDTTAATLSFCLFELSRNPTVVSKLRTEILERVGTRKPSYADLKEMKYLTAVLNEAMRLYPVVPFNVRHAVKDTTLPRGGGPDGRSPIGVPNDTRIAYSTMYMQRRPELYDPPPVGDEKRTVPYFDPAKYIPDRWVSGWQPRPWHFIPFNGGPRICLGQQFAMLEMGYTVTRILQHYSEIQGVGAPPVGVDPVFKFDVTLSADQELNMVFVKAEGK
ncbi:hypothetical protein FQN52_009622 [Onygenales sp. PD_12]|nr:hypothetical protein FQN52_009622 [Onygenales sp. PD_12]